MATEPKAYQGAPLISDTIENKLLTNTEQRNVAFGLANLLVQEVDNLDGITPEGKKWLQTALKTASQVAWGDQYDPASKNKISVKPQGSYEALLDVQNKAGDQLAHVLKMAPLGADGQQDPQLMKKFVELYDCMGHLYEIGGHVARENFFIERDKEFEKALQSGSTPTREQMVPGGIHEMLFNPEKGFSNFTVDQIIEKLNTPVSEYIFTQHPTNTNQLESMKLQRTIAQKVDDVLHGMATGKSTGLLASLRESVGAFMRTPVVSDKNFTAKDETDISINFLANAYHDLDRLYEVVDRGLTRKFGGDYGDDKKLSLDLKTKFGSWGSAGDKDGNNNLKSENTLEAIILHKKAAADLLAEELREFSSEQKIGDWYKALKGASVSYQGLIDQMEAIRAKDPRGNDIALTNDQFKDISEAAQGIAQTLEEMGGKKALSDELAYMFKRAGQERTKHSLLSTKRKLDVFGFSLGKIEYRETADEYSRAVAYILRSVPEVVQTGETEEPGQKERQSFYALAQEYVHTYDAYVTESKKTGTEKNDDLIKQLREDLSRPMEGLLEDKHRGLFIQHAQTVFAEMHGDALRDYKEDAAIAYHSLRRMELARDHSDMITHNVLAEAKDQGSLLEALAMQHAVTKADGTRAMLHIVPLFEEADTMAEIPNVLKSSLGNKTYHDHVVALKEREGTKDITQQIQIAHSDNARRAGAIASRGIIHEGHASARRAIDDYNKGHSQKVDLQFFEGGSLSDSYRNGVRAATAMVEDFNMKDFAKFTFQGGDLLNYFNQPTSIERLLVRTVVKQAELREHGSRANVEGINKNIERVVRDTLSSMQKEYDLFYDIETNPANPIGRLMHAIGYRELERAGNAGTRANRNAKTPADEDKFGIDSGKLRTIAFSMGFQHNNLQPSCLGVHDLLNRLSASMAKDSLARNEIEAGFANFKSAHKDTINADALIFDSKSQLTPEALQYLYKEGSAAFRDAVDKMSYSLYNTDIKFLQNKLNQYEKSHGADRDATLKNAFDKVVDYYQDAAAIVYSTLAGESYHWQRTNDGPEKLARAIFDIKQLDALEHLKPLSYKQRYVDVSRIISDATNETIMRGAGDDNERVTLKEYVDRLLYNTRATQYHGRVPMADDPTYRAAVMKSNGRNEGQGQGGGIA